MAFWCVCKQQEVYTDDPYLTSTSAFLIWARALFMMTFTRLCVILLMTLLKVNTVLYILTFCLTHVEISLQTISKVVASISVMNINM